MNSEETMPIINRSLVQATIRIRVDQKNRMESERRARGGTLADILRDNLDLAFAIKEELSQIVEGEYDENDPKNAPRLVHTLLFRVEERILVSLDNLAKKLEHDYPRGNRENQNGNKHFNKQLSSGEIVEEFISMLVNSDEYSSAVWIGAFLEIVPRLSLVGEEQLQNLEEQGLEWLKGHE